MATAATIRTLNASIAPAPLLWEQDEISVRPMPPAPFLMASVLDRDARRKRDRVLISAGSTAIAPMTSTLNVVMPNVCRNRERAGTSAERIPIAPSRMAREEE